VALLKRMRSAHENPAPSSEDVSFPASVLIFWLRINLFFSLVGSPWKKTMPVTTKTASMKSVAA
jgi:hypothetical protein